MQLCAEWLVLAEGFCVKDEPIPKDHCSSKAIPLLHEPIPWEHDHLLGRSASWAPSDYYRSSLSWPVSRPSLGICSSALWRPKTSLMVLVYPTQCQLWRHPLEEGTVQKNIHCESKLNFPFSKLPMNNALTSWVGRVPLVWGDWWEGELEQCWGGDGCVEAGPGSDEGDVGLVGASSRGVLFPALQEQPHPPCWITCVVSPGAVVREQDWQGGGDSLLLPLTWFPCSHRLSVSPLQGLCWMQAAERVQLSGFWSGPHALGFIQGERSVF